MRIQKTRDGILTLRSAAQNLVCDVPTFTFVTIKNDKNIIFEAVVVAVLDEEAWAVLNNGQHEISETLAILLGAIPLLK